jgi:hypothetical protein
MKKDMGEFIAKCESNDDQLESHDGTINGHDTRLRRLEVAVIPIYAAMIAGATWIASKLSTLIGKH